MLDLPLVLVTGVPDWVWLAIGVGILLLLVLAIVLVIHARPGRRPADDAALAWADAANAPLPDSGELPIEDAVSMAFPEPGVKTVEEPGADLHYCRCPACQTQFSVSGARPIVTNCPGCGKKGYLR